MLKCLSLSLAVILLPLLATTSKSLAQEPLGGAPGFGAIVLAEDDVAAFDPPPAGFADEQESIPHGKNEMIEYASQTVGTTRRMLVYTPPGYTPDKRYPVLYLLHGIGGDETEWQRFAAPNVLLDNLIAAGEAEPMIVVMPNGRAQQNDRAEGNIFQSAPAFETFRRDLLDDVIPTIQSRYSVIESADGRALAGLSMGGGQTLNFALTNLDTFAWIGAFSSAPNTKPMAELVPDVEALRTKARVIWLSCGNKDGLMAISQRVHRYLHEHDVPHTWHVDGHGHDPEHWRSSLYWFLQDIFKNDTADQ